MPVVVSGLVEVTASNPLRITGNVSTERSSDNADRVIVVGWEENAVRQKASTLQQLSDNDADKGLRALPIKMVK
jgi:hypothetical protein